MIDEELIEEYRKADYIVAGCERKIELDSKNNELDEFLATINPSFLSWALITAYNPESDKLSHKENRNRNERLQKDLLNRNYILVKAEGKDPRENWGTEKSFLVIDIPKNEAKILAKKYRQYAILFGMKEREAELVIL